MNQLWRQRGSATNALPNLQLLLAVVQDADRLDAIGAISIARCLTFGGARGRVLHNSLMPPCDPVALTKEAYQDERVQQTTINHFYEKLQRLRVRARQGEPPEVLLRLRLFLHPHLPASRT